MVAHAGFRNAQAVFEFGCGTGKFAARLLARHLLSSATYLGCDISQTMVDLGAQRHADYAERAKVVRSEGTVHFPIPDHSVDHVISNYVLDLLSEKDIRRFFAEAHRVLTPDGKLCLVSLTRGVTAISRFVSFLWMALFRMRASLVGGCRPILLERYVDREYWQFEYQTVLTPFGIPSEVLVLALRPGSASTFQ